MTSNGEFEPGLMTTELNGNEAFAGIQGVSTVRSTHRDDGSLVSPEPIALEVFVAPVERREDKLARLKAAIEGGQYFVASGDVAERLMQSMMLN